MTGLITGYDRASVLDLAILTGGSAECAMDFCLANGLSLTDEIEPGREYRVREWADGSKAVASRLAMEGVRPATALSTRDSAECLVGGIGLMGIEIDFRVG